MRVQILSVLLVIRNTGRCECADVADPSQKSIKDRMPASLELFDASDLKHQRELNATLTFQKHSRSNRMSLLVSASMTSARIRRTINTVFDETANFESNRPLLLAPIVPFDQTAVKRDGFIQFADKFLKEYQCFVGELCTFSLQHQRDMVFGPLGQNLGHYRTSLLDAISGRNASVGTWYFYDGNQEAHRFVGLILESQLTHSAVDFTLLVHSELHRGTVKIRIYLDKPLALIHKTHAFVAKLERPIDTLERKIMFVTQLARFLGDSQPRTILLLTSSNLQATWLNNSLSTEGCDNETVLGLIDAMVDNLGRLRNDFTDAMRDFGVLGVSLLWYGACARGEQAIVRDDQEVLLSDGLLTHQVSLTPFFIIGSVLFVSFFIACVFCRPPTLSLPSLQLSGIDTRKSNGFHEEPSNKGLAHNSLPIILAVEPVNDLVSLLHAETQGECSSSLAFHKSRNHIYTPRRMSAPNLTLPDPFPDHAP